ncbi:hypothetical protein [Dysgonomonas sp. 511]|uniref:hypothetical protein n=1 Tax=Dysgonomonas sp. 511 TaxID=2302930 RepID=UPI0013D0EDB5|nr:hypothetical protein [Dysgonomonas sp. 511]
MKTLKYLLPILLLLFSVSVFSQKRKVHVPKSIILANPEDAEDSPREKYKFDKMFRFQSSSYECKDALVYAPVSRDVNLKYEKNSDAIIEGNILETTCTFVGESVKLDHILSNYKFTYDADKVLISLKYQKDNFEGDMKINENSELLSSKIRFDNFSNLKYDAKGNLVSFEWSKEEFKFEYDDKSGIFSDIKFQKWVAPFFFSDNVDCLPIAVLNRGTLVNNVTKAVRNEKMPDGTIQTTTITIAYKYDSENFPYEFELKMEKNDAPDNIKIYNGKVVYDIKKAK